MNRTKLTVLLCLALLLSTFTGTGFAQDAETMLQSNATIIMSGSCGDNATWSIDEEFTLRIEGTGAIKSYSNSLPPWNAFLDYIEKIIVGDGITSIPSGTFKGCNALEEITVPFVGFNGNGGTNDVAVFGYIFGVNGTDSKTDLGENCVYQYKSSGGSYRHFYIPDSLRKVTVTGGKKIGDYAFRNCDFLTEINIPDTIVEIGTNAFDNCSGIVNIDLYEGITKINTYAFKNCSKLKEINIPSTITSIGTDAFNGCESLIKVNIPDFLSWSKIDFDSPTSNPTYYAKDLYVNDELLTEAYFSEEITSIKSYVLYNCGSVKKIVVPKNVTYINTGAFRGCDALEEITIPKIGTGTAVREEVFGAVFGYTETKTDGTVNQYTSTYNDGGWKYSHYYYYIPRTLRKVTITNATTIPDYAFRNCDFLTEINIPDTIVEIGARAFENCTNIKKFHLTDTVTSISTSSFTGCSDYEFYFKGSRSKYNEIENIAKYANVPVYFNDKGNCSDGVTWELTYDNKLIIDGNGTIDSMGYTSYLDMINSVYIGEGIEEISAVKFPNCKKITSYNVDEQNPNYTSVDGVIYNKDKTEIVAVPACIGNTFTIDGNVTAIANSAFKNCNDLITVYYFGSKEVWESIQIGSNNSPLENANIVFECCYGDVNDSIKWRKQDGTLIISGNGAMPSYSGSKPAPWKQYFDTITEIIVEDGITSIGNQNFAGLKNVKNATLPYGLESINKSAFINCESLETVNMYGSVNYIGTYAFNGCLALAEINVQGNKADFEKLCVESGNLEFDRALTHYTSDDGDIYASMSIYAKWIYDEKNKTLNVTNYPYIGARDMLNYKSQDVVPWCDFIDNIEAVTFNGVSCIGSRSLMGADNLKTAATDNNVTKVNSWAFHSCLSLEEITLSSDLEAVGTGAFYKNESLDSVKFNGTLDKYNNIRFGNSNQPFQRATTTLEDGISGFQGAAVYWSFDGDTLRIKGKGDMKSISSVELQPWYAYREQIKNVIIENGVTSVAKYAFSELPNLERVVMGNSVNKISAYSFKNSGVKTVIIPVSVSAIGVQAFADCNSLETVNYTGTETDFSNIAVSSGNNLLKNSNIVYSFEEV